MGEGIFYFALALFFTVPRFVSMQQERLSAVIGVLDTLIEPIDGMVTIMAY